MRAATRAALWISLAAALCEGAGAAPTRPMAGRPLAEVLDELRRDGLNVLYSSAVVEPGVSVTVEPAALDARAILDEILPPLGLAAQDGAGGSVLVVRAAPATPRGRVVSAGWGLPIVRASVVVAGTGAASSSRPDGTFELPPLPPGTYDLHVEAPGFLPGTRTAVKLAPGARAECVVALDPHPRLVEDVVVTPGRHAIVQEEPAARVTIDHDDAVTAPTIGGDVSRVVELLPGVAAPDNSAAFNLRGSVARDVSLVLDGLELYEPYHLFSFQSPFSVIDREIVDTIDVSGGGFTAERGDRHGGFVEMSTGLPAGPEEVRVELGTLNAGIAYGQPLPFGSLLLSARAWYPQAVVDSIEFGEEGFDPRFGDLYLKLAFNASSRTIVSAHTLIATDRVRYDESGGDETANLDDHGAQAWVRVVHSVSPSVLSETVVAAGRLDMSREGVSEPEDEPFPVTDERSREFYGVREDLTWRLTDTQIFKGGLEIRPSSATYDYVSGPAGEVTALHLEPSGTASAAYVAYRAAPWVRFAAELGLRWDRQSQTGEDQLSPRFNALARLGDRSEMRVSFGRYFQSQRMHELQIEDGETAFHPAELSSQAGLTFVHRFASGIRLRLDAYGRRLTHVRTRYENLFNPIELFPETEADRVEIAPERAELYGFEVLVRSKPDPPLQWWASYTWSRAQDVVDGVAVLRSWDQTHAGRGLVAYRWGRGWTASLSGTIRTGWPTTPMTAVAVPQPGGTTEIEPVVGPRNSIRFPTYARLDAKATRSIALRGGRLSFELEILNLTDRDNACCVDEFTYTLLPDDSVQVDRTLDMWLGITPTFAVRWAF